eukprot:1145448-Pelagomonas_calceolata.AAC.2
MFDISWMLIELASFFTLIWKTKSRFATLSSPQKRHGSTEGARGRKNCVGSDSLPTLIKEKKPPGFENRMDPYQSEKDKKSV